MMRPAEVRTIDRRNFLVAATAVTATSASGTFSSARVAEDPIRGNVRRLTEPGGGDNRATYMPDGRTLLFASKRSGKSQIWAVDPDGANPRLFHKSEANDFGRVAPSADGHHICFSSDRGGENAVYVLDLQNGAVTPVSDPAFWSFGPSWSSLDRIAFFSKKGGNRINLWTVAPDATRSRQITNQAGESRQPWWAPDGRTLAFSANFGSEMFQILLIDADGSHAQPITNRGSYEQPFWSPDGKRIAVATKLDGARQRIYVMASDGSDLRPIVQPDDDNVHPAWSPDGRSIVFTSGSGGRGALYAFDLA